MIASGATVGGGGASVVVAVVVVAGAAVCLAGKAARVAHRTTARTASVMNEYDSATPTRARSRQSSPVRRICASPRCPRTAPAGANTNANTTDSVAKVLTGRW